MGCVATRAFGGQEAMDLKEHIRTIADFPKPGILFYDISTLLMHAAAWQATVERLGEAVAPYRPDLLAGIESRGFLVAAPLALKLGIGFVMVRKQGKLPGKTVPYTYDLEYGSDTIEIQADAVEPGQRVVSGRRPAGHRRHHERGGPAAAQPRRRGLLGRLHHGAVVPPGAATSSTSRSPR